MAKNRPSIKTVADCVRVRYKFEDWFVRCYADRGVVRLVVRPECPIRTHRQVQDYDVEVMHLVEDPEAAAPEKKTPAAPGPATLRPAAPGPARKSVERIRKSHRDGRILDVAREIRARGSDGNRDRCESLAIALVFRLQIRTRLKRLREEPEHFALELADGRVLDPAADELGAGLPDIYLGPVPTLHGEADSPAEELPAQAVG